MSVILLDCDGVLCDFVGGLIGAYNAEHGTTFRPEDCDQWDIARAFGLKWYDLSPIVHREGFCYGLSALPGAAEAVRLLDRHCELFVVTSPFGSSKHWMFERTEWLVGTFGLCRKQIIFASDKSYIWGDALIDDRVETIAEWSSCWPLRAAILWGAPHNRTREVPACRERSAEPVGELGDAEVPSRATRVWGWDEAFVALRVAGLLPPEVTE